MIIHNNITAATPVLQEHQYCFHNNITVSRPVLQEQE